LRFEGITAFAPRCRQGLPQLISIKYEAVDQVRYADNLTALTGKQLETHKIAQGIREGQNLGRQSAF
jgi:hypothetical protein